MRFREPSEEEVRQIDQFQSEYFSENLHLFDPPLPDGVSERLEDIVRYGRIIRSDVVLDIGAGTGILIPLILKYEPARVVANDLSQKMLEMVKKRYPLVNTLHGDIRSLALPDQSVDVVFINACYSNIVDKPRSFTNIRRITRAGCRIVISHPMGSSFIHFLQERVSFPLDDFPQDRVTAGRLFTPYGFSVAHFVNENRLYVLVLEG
jgi:SAM-dependent methyltransferase